MIPGAVVEVAARAIHDLGVTDPWDGRSEGVRDLYREDARAALEAAAPHILAEVRGEGYGAGWNDCLLDLEKRGIMSRNPAGARND